MTAGLNVHDERRMLTPAQRMLTMRAGASDGVHSSLPDAMVPSNICPSCRTRPTSRQTMRGFFHRQGKFQPILLDDERPDQQIPEDLWVKCPKCGELIYSKELHDNLRVCPKCTHHMRLRARERIVTLVDLDTFDEWDA